MKSNSYAASTLRVEEAQLVVSTGPYFGALSGYSPHPLFVPYGRKTPIASIATMRP